MHTYRMTDRIKIGDTDKQVKTLTLEDLYYIYEKTKQISLLKFVNGEMKLIIDKEE